MKDYLKNFLMEIPHIISDTPSPPFANNTFVKKLSIFGLEAPLLVSSGNKKRSIEEIAHHAGFNSYNGFLVAYKKYYEHPSSQVKTKITPNEQ